MAQYRDVIGQRLTPASAVFTSGHAESNDQTFFAVKFSNIPFDLTPFSTMVYKQERGCCNLSCMKVLYMFFNVILMVSLS